MSQREKISSRSPETTCDLSDEEFERRLDDPSLIATHEEALAIITEVMANVANIDMQIMVYRNEVEVSGEDAVSPDRHAWYRRALYARTYRNREIDRVYKRDKELRGFGARDGAHKDQVAAALRAQRLLVEAEERRDLRRLQVAKEQRLIVELAAVERSSLRKQFLAVAREQLVPEMFESIMVAAQARRTASLAEQV